MKLSSTLFPVGVLACCITLGTACTKQNISTAAVVKKSSTIDSTGKNLNGQSAPTTGYPGSGNCNHGSGTGNGG